MLKLIIVLCLSDGDTGASCNNKLGNTINENLESHELILFKNNDGFQTNSKNGKRVLRE